MSTRIKKRNDKNSKLVAWKFDVKMLNMFLKYVVSGYVQMADLGNLKTLFDGLDMDAYKYNTDMYQKIEIIHYIARARVDHFMQDKDAIYLYVMDQDADLKEALDQVDWNPDQLGSADIRVIASSVTEKLQSYLIMSAREEIQECYDKMEQCQFYSMKEPTEKLRQIFSNLLVNLQNTNIGNGLVRSANFADDSFDDILNIVLSKAKKPGAILQTGIRQLNAILSPGFAAERLYVFLGLSGKFKSGTLLNIADQIRKFNPQIKAVEDKRRKTILFITMENSIEETIARLYDMYSDESKDFAVSSIDDLKNALRKNGGYNFTDNSGISIELRYYANMEITTAQLYNIVQDMEDNGKEVIALILDYIKRIDSPKNTNGDERIRLSYVAQELKSFAQYYEIPVITAMQLNREGNSIVDAAMREDKQDVLRFVGTANIGGAWAIVEESDWMAVINLEQKKSTGELFLTFKRVKIRGKSDITIPDYFNHPFANERNIRLETDVDKPMSLSVRSLATDLESVDVSKLDQESAISRPTLNYANERGRSKSQHIMESVKLDKF